LKVFPNLYEQSEETEMFMSGIFLISHALIGNYRNEIIQTLNGGIQVEILFINIYYDLMIAQLIVNED